MATKTYPEPYEKNAPRFDDAKPDELPWFLDSIERIMDLAKTDADDKNEFIIRYVVPRVADEWKYFDSFKTKKYADFKKEILENYPDAVKKANGSLRKLQRDLEEFEDGDIGMDDDGQLRKLIRVMTGEVKKLMGSSALTDREAVPMFMKKLSRRFRE
ncbi:hypothetical protein C8F01DRAFT_986596 [Mycena amicta]|nr:hypothetical protein C8F01DRAFT_986596 [Mycena amicta]